MSIQNNVLGPVPPQAGPDPYATLGNFDVIKTLGHGHFSVVYSARNRFNGTYVALKKVEVRKNDLNKINTEDRIQIFLF
jgi:serine/threonine protein kinase